MDGDEEEKNEDAEDEDGDAAISGYSDFPKPCLPSGSGKLVACVFGARHGALLRHRTVFCVKPALSDPIWAMLQEQGERRRLICIAAGTKDDNTWTCLAVC